MATEPTHYYGFYQRQLSPSNCVLPPPPSIPIIISSQDKWNPLSCQIETPLCPDPNDRSLKLVDDALELLRTIEKPLAVLAICGPYRSGKSYFISRVLGKPTFKLGHSMQACTRGIWMSTTILECEDFVTIVLDTEGIDAVGASETFAMSLLTLSTLLSSYLIYNSKKVPMKLDLDKMRCFTQLSTTLLSQCNESMTSDAKNVFFPKFLWLLRDVALKMKNRKGEEVGATEFLHSRILSSESGELTDLGRSLVGLFPSLECATLPVPSIKRDVIRGILEQQEKLKPAFNTATDVLIEKILGQISPKKAVDGESTVNGKVFVGLAEGYLDAINKPGAIPDLDQGWQAVVRLELHEVSNSLVKQYNSEMEDTLEGNLPMEEHNLLRIHQQILDAKKRALRDEIRRIDPLHSSDEAAKPVLDTLELKIAKWGEPDEKGKLKVNEGALYHFTSENYFCSKRYCQKLFTELVEVVKIHKKFQKSVAKSIPLDIAREIEMVTEKYITDSIGPATKEVLETGLSELNQLSDTLKMIPGAPQKVEIVGTGVDQIKLSWEPPKENPEAVDEYVICIENEDGELDEVARTKKTTVLIKNLRSDPSVKAVGQGFTEAQGTKLEYGHKANDADYEASGTSYKLLVASRNNTITSIATGKECSTLPSTAQSAAFSVGFGVTRSLLFHQLTDDRDNSSFDSHGEPDREIKDFIKKMLSTPVRMALAPITIPALTLKAAVRNIGTSERGDLTED